MVDLMCYKSQSSERLGLILGQIAFVVTVLGKKLPSHSAIASLVLTFFAIIQGVSEMDDLR